MHARVTFNRTVKLPQPSNGLPRVLGRLLNHEQGAARAFDVSEVGAAIQEKLRQPEDHRQAIVDVVSNSTRHLAQGSQFLIVGQLLLRSIELTERGLRRTMLAIAVDGQRGNRGESLGKREIACSVSIG